jgi:hypothetical protein
MNTSEIELIPTQICRVIAEDSPCSSSITGCDHLKVLEICQKIFWPSIPNPLNIALMNRMIQVTPGFENHPPTILRSQITHESPKVSLDCRVGNFFSRRANSRSEHGSAIIGGDQIRVFDP